MSQLWKSWTAVCIALVATVAVAAEMKSGLKVGASVPPFTVHDVTGPLKGEDLCYRCRYGAQPVVSVFAKEMTPEVVALTKQLDGVVAEHRDEKMAGFVVLLTDDPAKQESVLEAAAKENKIEQLPLTTFDGVKGPSGYSLSKDADYTVMMWVDNKVKASMGFKKGDLNKDTIASIVTSTSQILE